MGQQNNNNNNLIIKSTKKQRKSMPIEILVNIFKTASNISLINLIKSQTTNSLNELKRENNKTKKDYELKKCWYKFASNFLTSSGIIYFFVGENFKKLKILSAEDDGRKKSFEKVTKSIEKIKIHLEFAINQLNDNDKIVEGRKILASWDELAKKTKKFFGIVDHGGDEELSCSVKRPLEHSSSSSDVKPKQQKLQCELCNVEFNSASAYSNTARLESTKMLFKMQCQTRQIIEWTK